LRNAAQAISGEDFMPSKATTDVEIQQKYYAESAHIYNEMHDQEKGEHYIALGLLAAMIDYFGIRSILDIGSGTGRAVAHLKKNCPGVRIVGVEPVKELREIGYQNGLSRDELIDGDALKLNFRDGEFDAVCEFGVLHHIKTPGIAVGEMLRVAKKIIFISDSNNFGRGSLPARSVKHLLNFLGLWKAATLLQTRGKGYYLSKEDGLAYSYSVFDNYKQIEDRCKRIHLLNTASGKINPYKTASHVALVGVKSDAAS
jgi:ubiquinone/menaquinone biosynthesis C-methylase UbiE